MKDLRTLLGLLLLPLVAACGSGPAPRTTAYAPEAIAAEAPREQPAGHVRMLELLQTVGLPHKLNMKPLDLSAGEQQRVAIARALINQPAILLADEPTGNLDSANSHMILELFSELNQRLGQTVVMITHNMEATG